MSKALWVLRLSKKSKVLVSVGDTVSFGTEIAKLGKKTFKAPCLGKIVTLNKDEIKMEFQTEKISGQSVGKGKCWGKLVFSPDLDFLELTIADQGKIFFVKKPEALLLKKALALGVAGVVCFGFTKKEKPPISQLPILIIPEKDETVKLVRKSVGVNCLLNLSAECLLIPESKKNEN